MDRILYMAFAAWTFVIALTMLLIYQRELEALQEQVSAVRMADVPVSSYGSTKAVYTDGKDVFISGNGIFC